MSASPTLSPPTALAGWNLTRFPLLDAAWLITPDFAGYAVERPIPYQAEREYAWLDDDDNVVTYGKGVIAWLEPSADMDEARAQEALRAWRVAEGFDA